MTPAQTFSAAHLAGVAAGIVGGTLLPWWASGAVAWVLAGGMSMGCLIAAAQHWSRAITPRVYWRAGPDERRALRFIIRARWRADMTAAILGVFWGAFGGALAADSAEVLDALLWPGHDSAPAVLAAIGVSGGYAAALISGAYLAASRRLFHMGLVLYVLTALLSFGPGVLSEAKP